MEGGGSGEGVGGGVGGGASSSGILLCGGGRQRFEVELRPGETTIVSWKKLMKDANKAANNNNNKNEDHNSINKGVDVSVNPAPIASSAAVNPALDSRIAPVSGGAVEKEAGDAPPGSRFNAVIEKIERLYMGKNSSDEEDLNDVPDDDEYDTADSFIDDTELDDYFQVDNSAIKHDGFFVNRGKLERINVPTALPTEQPKKRRRKDSIKGDNGNNEGHMPNKHMKVNKTERRKIVTSVDKNSITPSHSVTLQTNNEDSIYQNTVLALGTVVKKPSNSKTITDVSSPRGLNGDARATTKNIEKQKTEVLQLKKHGSKLSDGGQTHVLSNQKASDKNADLTKSQGQLISSSEKLNQSVLPREKSVVHQPADIKASEVTLQPKTTNMVRKEGSSSKPKSSNLLLEKAIKDLEKTVAEVRPPSMEDPEADTSSQAVKRRMPPEIKQKLAKVARLAHAIHGKLSKELLNRLLSILGHLIQLRSLKRNLQNMVEMGLSAKEEKDGKVQQLKKEVDQMVKIRAPMMKPEAIKQQAESSGDFQETSSKEKVKSRFITDDALEDKICDLYDLYVDGLDEDANPQIRKLYAELADLWPKGCMDNHGIRRAICRAKDRRRELCRQKDQENMKRKNLLPPKTETVSVSAGSAGQVQPAPEKPITDSSAPLRSITKTIAACSAALPPNSSTEMPKQEKLKGISNNQVNTTGLENLVKKSKKKPDAELNADLVRSEKSTLAHGKQTVSGLVKPATQPSPITSAPTGPPPAQPAVSSSVDLV